MVFEVLKIGTFVVNLNNSDRADGVVILIFTF